MSNDEARKRLETRERLLVLGSEPALDEHREFVEREGVRVYVSRVPAKRCLMIQTALKRETYNSIFEITDHAIEETETADMEAHVLERIREQAVDLRRYALVDILERDIGLANDKHRAYVVKAIAEYNDSSVCERLALDLMAHVERIGR